MKSITKADWIDSARLLNAERFEIAGALYDVEEKELIQETEVLIRLHNYKGGV
ncbi:hypothetical protein [Brevibacillus daliensis]|uniref:hypothetical protein n=1 Tax=Brevibacillus daliensis TaxID=2892995 RepID=UPI001E566B18|nr:hypothetical protein [Brevibacillus daliensis]